MKKYMKKILIVLFVSLTIISILLFVKNRDKIYIKNVLSSESYSYLSDNAKKYIEEVYNKTGEVVLTEKNKKENTPYLNPSYDEYLSLSEEEKSKISAIPSNLILDYIPRATGTEEDLPSYYNLNNIDNNSYLTPMKSQGSLGLCWAFSLTEHAESHLMIRDNKSYNENTLIFSPRQLDYALSDTGIENFNNKYITHKLGDGNDRRFALHLLSLGLGLVEENKFPYTLDKKNRKLYDVLNYNNSLYELNASVNMPTFAKSYNDYILAQCTDAEDVKTCTNELTQELSTQYINELKKMIIKYGGGIATTIAPTSDCSFKNTDGEIVTEERGLCSSIDYLHDMQIIGFDDNYEYSYCNGGSKNYSVNSEGKCDKGTLTTGTGAFILRNSWGEKNKFPYLTYKTISPKNDAGVSKNFLTTEFTFISSLSSMAERNWDNTYSNIGDLGLNISTINTLKKLTENFTKKINTDEKLEKIKFNAYSQDGIYNINIVVGDKNYNFESISTEKYPGIFTYDLSKENIIIDKEEFSITISSNKAEVLDKTIAVFTSNVDTTPIIKTEDTTITSNEFNILSQTKNINSGEKINYALYDGETELTDYINVSDNIVADNEVLSSFTILKPLQDGEYTLKISYGDNSYDSKIIADGVINSMLEGDGTINNPYLIKTEEDLKKVSKNLNSCYKLANDITLTEKWAPIGTKENPFTGVFDGDGHSISNLNIENKDEYNGLFGYVTNNSNNDYDMSIKNLKIKEASIMTSNDTGILAGHIELNKEDSIIIENIYLINGNIESPKGNIGALVGSISSSNINSNLQFVNIFNSANVIGGEHSGLVGSISNVNVSFSIIQNTGLVIISDSTTDYGTLVGKTDSEQEVVLDNFVFTALVKGKDFIKGQLTNYNLSEANKSFISQGYYLKTKNDDKVYSYSGNKVHAIESFDNYKDKSSYNDLTDFDNNWNLLENNSIIPVIKDIDFTYTSIEDIDINIDEEISLVDKFSPMTRAFRVSYEVISGNDHITLNEVGDSYLEDIIIKGVTPGIVKLHVKSNYDNFDKTINVNVHGEGIVYDSNNSTGETIYKKYASGSSITLEDKNTFKWNGYEIAEWNTKNDGSGESYIPGSSFEYENDMTLYAIWKLVEYNINYDLDGGSFSDKIYPQTYSILDEGITFKTPVKEGYKFLYYEVVKGNDISFKTGDKIYNDLSLNNDFGDVTLKAIWTENTYKVKYCSDSECNENKEIDVKYNEIITIEKDLFNKNGYKLTKYNTKSDGSGTDYNEQDKITIKNDLTLYAVWTEIKFSINYCFDESCELGEIYEYSDGEEVTIINNENKVEGKIFDSWNTKKDGTGKSFKVNEKIIIKESYTLYSIFVDDVTYIIEKYRVIEDSHYISRIMPNTTKDEFTSNIKLGTNYSVNIETIKLEDKDLLYTGSKTSIYKGSNVYDDYINIVIGDIDGDAEVTSSDLLKVRQHLIGTKVLDGIYLLSADIDDDAEITSSDLLRIRQHLIGTKAIS